jgi:16S rRNA (guanine966-N2)-methyltransferase
MASRSATTSGQLRIIGGRWRGRKLRFRASAGLRPTPDRVRETLFNWLSTRIASSRCLDLFAGSGALGLEALSRGAAHCCFVDCHAGAVAAIREHLAQLGCSEAECIQADAMKFLRAGNTRTRYDIVFLDPPFLQHTLDAVCAALESGDWLADDATVYMESSVHDPEPAIPAAWTPHRDKRAGEVRYRLFVRNRQFV